MRQRHRWKKAAATHVPIDAKLGLPMGREEIQPVPEGWKPIALAGQGIVTVQRGRQRCDGGRRDDVVASFSTPDPVAQVLAVGPREGLLQPLAVFQGDDAPAHHAE